MFFFTREAFPARSFPTGQFLLLKKEIKTSDLIELPFAVPTLNFLWLCLAAVFGTTTINIMNIAIALSCVRHDIWSPDCCSACERRVLREPAVGGGGGAGVDVGNKNKNALCSPARPPVVFGFVWEVGLY